MPVASHSGLMRPCASPVTDVPYAAHSDISYSVLLTNPNPHSILHSGSITPFSDLSIIAHSNLSHSALLVASHRGLSIGGLALSAKYLSGN